MSGLFQPFLFLHILGAIVALGPAFAFPVIGAMGGREPQYGNFATRVTHFVDDRVTLPFILLTAVTGVGLIWAGSLPLFETHYRWLLLSIAVYAIALAFSWFVQRPNTLRVIELTGGFPGGDLGPSATPAPAAPAAGGPPPQLMAAIRQSQRNGLVLTVLSIAIVFLMVVKPSLTL